MNSTLPRRTYLYFTAQSINLTTAVMSVTMAAIVGLPWRLMPHGPRCRTGSSFYA